MSVSRHQPLSPKGSSSEPNQPADPAEVQKVKSPIEKFFKKIPEKSKEVANLQQRLTSDLEGNVTVETVNKVNKLVRIILFTENVDEFFRNSSPWQSLEPKYLNPILWLAIEKVNKTGEISENIGMYGIEDQKILIEIAKIAAAQNGEGVSYRIQNYGIRNEEALMEIAKIAAAQNGEGVSRYIQKYGIRNEEALIEIAKIAAAQNGEGVSYRIQNYGIRNEESLIEIAKIAAAQDGGGVSQYIQKYRITNEEALIEIAKIAAAQTGRGVSQYIQNYGIRNEEALIEIAKIAAAQNGEGVSQYIQNYGIRNEEALIEIAKIAAAQNGEGVSCHIQNYWIRNEEVLIEIAKKAAAQTGEGVSFHILNYRITNEEALIEIAKIAAAQDGEGVSQYIQNYRITNEKALIEIATICIRSSKSFIIIDQFLNFFPNGIEELLEDYESLVFFNFSCLASRIPKFAFKDFSEEDFNTIASYLSLLIKEGKTLDEKEEFLKRQTTGSLCNHYAEWVLLPLSSDFQSKAPLEQLKKHRNSLISYALLGEFMQCTRRQKYQEAYSQLAIHVTDRMLSIIPAKWMEEAGITKAPSELLQFFKNFKKILKERNKPLLQRYLITVLQLNALEGIPSQRKLELLKVICNQEGKENVLKGLSYLGALAQRKAIKELNELPLQEVTQKLGETFKDLLSSDPDIKISDIEDFADLYLEMFGETRIPLAFEIYKARIASLKNPPLMSELERFVRSVLLGTFSKERFRTDVSSHLKKIEETSEEVFTGWKLLTYSKEILAVPLDQKEEQFSFADFFKEKLSDGHSEKNGVDRLPQLTQYVQKTSASEPSEEIPVLCKRLMEETSLSKDEQVSILRQLIEKLEENPLTCELELNHDLKGLISSLSSPKSRILDEKVILSRDWQDLLLCGTEVLGSCLRIDGKPNLNKCLIAYCMDGKNALIAVKNEEGKILARSLLRLLWNKTTSKPALFLDRLYPNPCPSERKDAIMEAAIECSKDLGIDLFTQWGGYKEDPNTFLESFRGPCSYEYEDAAGEEIKRNGVFTIKNLRKVELTV